jgi:imidazolonepropionase-like amidohydrolase
MRALHAGAGATVRRATEAGVRVFAGTDAGGMVAHGRIADEVLALHRAGMSEADALGAASWAARDWLGRPGLAPGDRADLVLYPSDPRAELDVLREPAVVLLRGRPVGRSRASRPHAHQGSLPTRPDR